MFVSDQDGGNVAAADAEPLQAAFRFTQGKPAIDHEQGIPGSHQGRVATAAASQGCELHARLVDVALDQGQQALRQRRIRD